MTALRFLLFLSLAVPLAFAQDDQNSVTVLGLGMMGQALVKCFHSQGLEVHAWNRSAARRQQLEEMGLEGVTIHENAQDAVEASETIIVMFASEAELKSVREFVSYIPKNVWKGRTLVNFATQEPFAAKDLEVMLKDYQVEHVGGAMIATPETICGPGSIVLTSAPERSTKAFEKVTPTLQVLGRLEAFPGDVGYGALVDIGMIQTLLFGITGFELSMLFLEKYGIPDSIFSRYVSLSKEIFPIYFPLFFDVVSGAVHERNWNVSYMTAEAMEKTLEMHAAFFKKMGIVDDTLNNAYLKYVKKVSAVDATLGVSSVIKFYSTDDFSFSDQKDEL